MYFCVYYKSELEGTYPYIVQYYPYKAHWKSGLDFSVRKKYSSSEKWTDFPISDNANHENYYVSLFILAGRRFRV